MRYLFFLIAFFFILSKTSAQENDSVEIVYDTLYTADTIHQKQEVTVVHQEEYVLDLSTGISFGYSIPFIRYKGDSTMKYKKARTVAISIPFTANFKPFTIISGLMIEQLTTDVDLQYQTSKTNNTTINIIDTLDVYYVTKNGITE
jgi:hypothetical protein